MLGETGIISNIQIPLGVFINQSINGEFHMSDINQATEYSNVVTNVRAAIRGELTSVNKWQTAGEFVRKFYGAESAIAETKAQFIADAIIPELSKAHQAALVRELPRKGSAEYLAFVQSHGADAWDAANQAKKTPARLRIPCLPA